ncbi:unnamed protein product [Mytilus edulis]|uniref:Uncharacterized protein n=1 Tax=Mytilus edulis TaxID=6550 RepID=A0A8S3R6B7_MYTED|nr:unnamed protein product [Mytilus edulis]
MGKWSIQEQENEFFLTIMGVRSIDPQTKQTYQKIEKIVCGRSADELVIKFHNTKHGRHLLRQNFDATTAAGKHINPNLSNRVFINSYEALSGTEPEQAPATGVSRKRKRAPFMSDTDRPDTSTSISNKEIDDNKIIGKFTINKAHLKEPPTQYKLREIKEEWVGELKNRIISSGQKNLGKILPVLVDSDKGIKQGRFQGRRYKPYTFLTLGGNHIRRALEKVVEIQEVTCMVYVKLTQEEALRIACIDNDMAKVIAIYFQDKIKLAHQFHLESVEDLNRKMKEVLSQIEMKEIKDSISTVLSVARYPKELFDLFETIVQNYEVQKGVNQSVPQRLFRLLQAETNVTRTHFLQMAVDNKSIQKTVENLHNNKKEQALERIFTEQTREDTWKAAVEKYPNYTKKLNEFKDMKTPRYVPDNLLKYCKKAKESEDQLDKTQIEIKVIVGSRDVSNNKDIAAILSKYSKIILDETNKVEGLHFEE